MFLTQKSMQSAKVMDDLGMYLSYIKQIVVLDIPSIFYFLSFDTN